jgi:hypothetical protein
MEISIMHFWLIPKKFTREINLFRVFKEFEISSINTDKGRV